MSGYTPYPSELGKRKIIADNSCECCKRAPEIGIHVLWECGVAQDVRAGSQVKLQKHNREHADTLQLFESLLN